ncbi:hypothetical protein CLV84_0757 [Neolewinella xylanilytica]|uniref:Uncharacterized protein n=1 Tax=Neolewinella xylanilytica TaxID=1514080 RepID=A0A2S6I8I1_9BACT|nr:hypothetical protein [Neolewinella xylanilytica]PPK87804.1 hypothetical protein CLV84_0757 [Neolewinella xylanilytica]
MKHAQATELIERYFAGSTSLEEEAALKAYFRNGDVAPQLQHYAPLFHYWEAELATTAPPKRTAPVRKLPRRLLAVAAAILLLLTVQFVHRQQAPDVTGFPVAQRQPVDWSRHEITDEKEAMRFLKKVLKNTSENLTKAPEITIRELREVERILD